MNFIILAAGRGRRLFPLTRDCPKSLLDLGDGTTILDRQLVQVAETQSITKVTVVTGYRDDMIEEHVARYRDAVEIDTIFNPFFDVSNALMSLWCAYWAMDSDDFCISNGDNVYRDGIVQEVITSARDGITLAVSHKDSYDEDDMKVLARSDQALAQVSTTIPIGAAQADSVGLAIVKGESSRNFFRETLLEMVHDPSNLKSCWQESLNGVVNRGGTVNLHEVPNDGWAEVDFHPDMEAMRRAVLSNVV